MKDDTYITGAGNSFFIAYNIGAQSEIEIIRRVADSPFDIDGVISISTEDDNKNILSMDYYNADGSRAELCLNGVRCAAKYAYDNNYTDTKSIQVITPSGKILTSIKDKNIVSGTVDVPLLPNGLSNHTIQGYSGVIVNVGNPHFVIQDTYINKIDLDEVGAELQNSKEFDNGINVEFCSIETTTTVNARVYERGVGETLACGSGAIAIFYVLYSKALIEDDISVIYPGGVLNLKIDNNGISISGEITYL